MADAAASDTDAAFRGTRPVCFDGVEFVDTATYARDALRAGSRIEGPALIEEYASTTVVQPGDVLTLDRPGNLIIEIGR